MIKLMRKIYDLDGTLYDAKSRIIRIDDEIMLELGYQPVSEEAYMKSFQSKDWRALYKSLGIREEHIDKAIEMFFEKNAEREQPFLIPGAKKILLKSVQSLGFENNYIITNEPPEGVEKRFERDGLTFLLPNVRSSYQGKEEEILKLAKTDLPVAYIGDIVADGEECLKARERGATNLMFWGLTHKYSFNPPDMIKAFVDEHQDFARAIDSLEEIEKILS